MSEQKQVKQEEKKSNKKSIAIIILLLAIILGLGGYILTNKEDDTQNVDQTASEYVKPEKPYDRSKNVTLPGWGGFTIKAGTKDIEEGFEFHNPEANYWYEDTAYINGKKLEKLVVDSGVKVELDHYLKLANVKGSVKSVKSYDKNSFDIKKDNNGKYAVEAIGGFKGKSDIVVKTTKGKSITITMKGKTDLYYMSFGLYLKDGDELLYQSGLVAPGKYIQKMTMNKPLKKGTYDAYVKIQPYRSDKKTETNAGVVNLKLNVQ